MPTALIPSVIGLGGQLISGLIGRGAAKSAATAQANAQNQVIQQTRDAVATGQQTVSDKTGNANDVLSRSAATQLGMYQPYAQAGQTAVGDLQSLSGAGGPLDQKFSFTGQDLQNDPGYQFTLNEGNKAIQRASAAKGGLFSGATLKSLAGYTTGLADTTFGNAFNRAAQSFDINRSTALSRINSLQGLAGLGYNATGAGANAVGSTSAQQANNTVSEGNTNASLGIHGADIIGRAITGRGDAEAAGKVGAANSTIGMIGGITNTVGKGIGDFLNARQLKNMGGGSSGSGTHAVWDESNPYGG